MKGRLPISRTFGSTIQLLLLLGTIFYQSSGISFFVMQVKYFCILHAEIKKKGLDLLCDITLEESCHTSSQMAFRTAKHSKFLQLPFIISGPPKTIDGSFQEKTAPILLFQFH